MGGFVEEQDNGGCRVTVQADGKKDKRFRLSPADRRNFAESIAPRGDVLLHVDELMRLRGIEAAARALLERNPVANTLMGLHVALAKKPSASAAEDADE